MQRLPLLIWLTWLFLIILCVTASKGEIYTKPISPAQAKCVCERTDAEARLNPIYLKGGSGLNLGEPGDCSGKARAICASCGIQVDRLTSYDMAAGEDGWNFEPVDWYHMESPSLLFFTVTAKRPYGHVGLVIKTERRAHSYRMGHASSTLGFVVVPVTSDEKNWFFDRLVLMRQLVPVEK